ncbi:MAG: IS66 family transposase [Natronospirillum sp.]
MKTQPQTTHKNPDISGLPAADLVAMVGGLQAQLNDQKSQIEHQASLLKKRESSISERDQYIQILEELLRLKKAQQFSASSEKHIDQIKLFDETELEAEIEALRNQLPDDLKEEDAPAPRKTPRKRGFSDNLARRRIDLFLSDEAKAGADSVFFAKIKEELHFIPAHLEVLEYWQEKAVFNPSEPNGQDQIIAAERPVHPLGKCQVTTSLLAYLIVSKYADGLPLYRQEQMLKRLGQDVSRTSMAQWIIRLEDVFKPLIHLMRETQNASDYLQADETRNQVLKEIGKAAQSDKWMWVIRGGPPGQPSVLFAYDPSRAGRVPVRLLDDFQGILQADGYSGYGQICRANGITRIGCWDHARRKFMEAIKAAKPTKGQKNQSPASKADMAMSYINKLYRIERQIKDSSVAERYRVRQELSVPALNAFKAWLEANVSKVMKGSRTRIAMEYTLNQWDTLVGYCERGDLHISNVLAENAIRPFAIGRKAWLFADTTQGAHASATCYSLIETAKANDLNPAAYIQHILDHIAKADTVEKIEALLPWNVDLERTSKKVAQYA